MPAENNKSSQPAAIPVICGQKISVDFGQRKAVITLLISFYLIYIHPVSSTPYKKGGYLIW